MEDKPRRDKTPRAETIARYPISLTKENPLERLKEFCHQGRYRYRYRWNRHANGFMMECSVIYFLRGRSNTLVKEVSWIETENLVEAKSVIAAILLQNVGLGMEELEEEITSEKVVEMGMKMATGLLSHAASWADEVENDD